MPAFLKSVIHLVVDHLVGIVSIVGEDVNAAAFKMLENGSGAGGGAALPVVALTQKIHAIPFGIADKFGKSIRFGQIGFVGQAKISETMGINVMNGNIKNAFALSAIVQPVLRFLLIGGRVKADDGGVFGKAVLNEL